MSHLTASIAQLGERKTEDLEAPCSIHSRSTCRGGLVGYDGCVYLCFVCKECYETKFW